MTDPGPDGGWDPTRPRVWLIDLTDPDVDALADSGVVSEAERGRAAAFGDAELRRRLLVRRSALRMLLSDLVGERPDRLEILTAPGGKPVLRPRAGRSLAFSVAHSGDLYTVALAPVGSLGVDVERLRTVGRARSIARRWFGNHDASALDGLDGDDLIEAFMRLWTAKEALAKRHGAGLRLMSGASAELDVAAPASTRHLRFFRPRDGYSGAIASTEPIEHVDVVEPEAHPWKR